MDEIDQIVEAFCSQGCALYQKVNKSDLEEVDCENCYAMKGPDPRRRRRYFEGEEKSDTDVPTVNAFAKKKRYIDYAVYAKLRGKFER